jgi:tRNA threonylcarbamoyladenosine biosynthesis protein TsaB
MSEIRATGGDRGAPVVLAFDAAGSACSVAIGQGERVLGYERREMRHGHAEALLPMIDRVMTAAGLTPGDVGAVAVSVGPGGFTGIRAGLAAAHGLALAVGASLAGVTSFTAVAARAPDDKAPLLVALDSRRDDLYVQLFAGGAPHGAAAAVLPADLASFVATAIGDAPLRIAGDAAEAAAAALARYTAVAIVAGSAPDALGVLEAGRRGVFDPAARALYLRPPDVSFPKLRSGGAS